MNKWLAKFKSLNAVAGILFLLNAFLYFGFWYIYLFTYQPACNSIWEEAFDSFMYAFSDENLRSIMVWMVIAPVFCCILAAAYFSRHAHSRKGALALFIASITLGLATLVMSKGGAFAIFIALPIFFGWRCFAQVKSDLKS